MPPLGDGPALQLIRAVTAGPGETLRTVPVRRGAAISPPTPVLVHLCASQSQHTLAVADGSSAASERRASRALPCANVVNCDPTLLG
jgi:hypothetical protein